MPHDESPFQPPPTEPDVEVYLIRIRDRPHGFRVVAYVGQSEAEALAYVAKHYGAQFDPAKPRFARIEHRCHAQPGCAATMTYKE